MKNTNKKISLAARVNIIRAGVMGANDGIVSVAGIVIGVAGARVSTYAILLSGLAGMLAGTISMAMGEWVSVSTQRDSEKMAMIHEKERLDNNFGREFEYIKNKYVATGISDTLAAKATNEMLQDQPLEVGVRERYGFNPNEKTSAISAAIASMISFPIGSALPLLTITLLRSGNGILVTMISVVIALIFTGWAAAKLGNADPKKAVVRNVLAGLLTMVVTYIVGTQFV
ncbi:VIT1/CCC1 transporter family protein [Paucilactobacillus nenjiangensis]|jgi:VIT1/CCC1 family predicted Fe2+/Mn2+ transporter|uniref:VIT family protein n=1 Tax=Paucilactobacillus nenjiangensis TaxID=1296540 RepID=A0A5P1X1C8_9LACO|nr:VIT family protein [Paucilactobacillus nenjiangensis]QER67626.1 VIT family protein [Paucilactobacillus nenjiangensis]